MSPRMITLGEGQEKYLRANWTVGEVTIGVLAAKLGCSVRTVRELGKRLTLGPRGLASEFWTDERADLATRLYRDEHISPSVIAERLGTTRLTVVTKLSRLGVIRRRSDPKLIAPRPLKAPPVERAPAKAKPVAACHPKPRKEPAKLIICGNGTVLGKPAGQDPKVEIKADVWAPLPGSGPVTLMGLRSTSCKWPVELQGKVEHHFCGNFSIGKYCAEHVRAEAKRSATQNPKADKHLKALSRIATRAA